MWRWALVGLAACGEVAASLPGTDAIEAAEPDVAAPAEWVFVHPLPPREPAPPVDPGIPGCAPMFRQATGACTPLPELCPPDTFPVPLDGCLPFDAPGYDSPPAGPHWTAWPRGADEPPSADRPSLEEVVALSAPGDVIYLLPGTHSAAIEVQWPLEVRGSGASRTLLEWRGGLGPQGLHVLWASADLTLSGVRLEGHVRASAEARLRLVDVHGAPFLVESDGAMVLERCSGLVFSTAGSLVVTDSAPRDLWGTGADVLLSNVALVATGLGDSTRLTGHDVALVGADIPNAEGHCDLSRVSITNGRITCSGSLAHVRGVNAALGGRGLQVRDFALSGGTSAAALELDGSALRGTVRHHSGDALLASRQASVTLVDVLFEDIRAHPTEGGGRAIRADIGTSVHVERVRVSRATAAGISLYAAEVHGDDLLVEATAARDGVGGVGLAVQSGSTVELERAELRDLRGAGVWVDQSHLTLTDTWIHNAESGVLSTGDPVGLGDCVAIRRGRDVVLRQVLAEGCERAAFMLSDTTGELARVVGRGSTFGLVTTGRIDGLRVEEPVLEKNERDLWSDGGLLLPEGVSL